MDKVMSFRIAACVGMTCAIAGLPAAEAIAQKVDFAGKRVEAIVPFQPGGGSDVYIRALAPHLERHLPGNPTIIVRNVPGGGSIPGANQFQSRAKPDGLNVIVVSASTVSNFVFQKSKVQYDLDKWQPVLLSPQGAVLYAASGLGVKGAQEIAKLKGQRLVFGGGGPTGAEMRFTIAFELLGLDVKYVWGVQRGPTRLAFERGEFNINYDTTPAYKKNASQLVKAGKAVPLFTLGIQDEKGNIVRDPNFPDLPTFTEVYERMHGKKPSGPGYEAWKAVMQMNVMASKSIFLPTDTPRPVVEAWRAAARNALKDPEFEKLAASIVEGYPQFGGEAARPIIKEATTLSPAVQDWLRTFLKTKHDVTY